MPSEPRRKNIQSRIKEGKYGFHVSFYVNAKFDEREQAESYIRCVLDTLENEDLVSVRPEEWETEVVEN